MKTTLGWSNFALATSARMQQASKVDSNRPNISRWLPKIQSREAQRAGSSLWQDSRRLVREWIRETSQVAAPPLQLISGVLLQQILEQGHSLNVADRARIMGVSVPTYHKRLQDSQAP